MADFTLVDHSSSSTGEILFGAMSYRKDLVDSRIATCLFAAILTDTGRFTYSNVRGKTFEAAAELVSLGADPHFVAESYYENVSDGQMHLMGMAASRMQRAGGGAIAYTSLSSEDFLKAGAGPEAAQEFAELARSLEGVQVGVLLRDVGNKVKVSLRSKASVDVKVFAERYGGGGHRRSAGFLLELPLTQAEIEVIRGLEDYLK
jgi:phosphoesterase RecJ-like protein